MPDKKRLLVCGITMNCAGTEKAFLSMLSELDFDRYDVTLLIAKREGLLLDLIPKQVKVIGPMEYGDMFLLSGANAAKTIWNTMAKKNPLILFEVLPYFLKILFCPKKRSFTATRLWCRLLRHFKSFEEEFGQEREYDAAIAFWGDRTMFYMCDKVKAKRKIAWLHFDYSFPPRDDELYLKYFERCDYIVNVSRSCHEALVGKLPQIADKCVMMENINSPSYIRNMALRGETFPDRGYSGKRILSIMRICEQKGYDFIVPALKKLIEDGFEVRWYILGGGDKADIDALKVAAVDNGVADCLILLGTTVNPYGYLRDADIFALPSRYEGKPITIEEAKMLYKPIACSDFLSAREQLDNGRLGIIDEIGSEGIYRSLKKLLSDPELCDEFTERLAAEDFGNAVEIKKLYRMLGEDE